MYSASETIQGFFHTSTFFVFLRICFHYSFHIFYVHLSLLLFLYFLFFYFILYYFLCSKSFSRASVQARSPCIISVIRSLQHLFDYTCRENRFFKKGHILFILYRTNGTKKISEKKKMEQKETLDCKRENSITVLVIITIEIGETRYVKTITTAALKPCIFHAVIAMSFATS